jgi:lysophospholipase L1-like esterase
MRSLRPIAARVVLLCGSLLVAFGVLELSFRVVYPPPVRFLYPQEFYDLDPEIGFALRPGQTAFTHDRPVQTNSWGLRDHEFAPEPAPGTLRVLALGDSQTFGAGLALSETWPKQLERRLQAGPRRWEVVNAGVPGTDTWQHEIILRRLLELAHPNAAVVLALYVNDVVPRPDPRSADAPAQTNTRSKRFVYLLKRSAVLTWIYHRLLVRWYARQLGQGSSTEEAVLAGTNDARAERGWQEVEQSLTAMNERCAARGVPLIVAILPRRDQVSGSHPGRAYNERARRVATAHGIEAIDLLPDLVHEYRVKGDALFIPWDGHNSAATNHVIAGRLAERLADLAPRLRAR